MEEKYKGVLAYLLGLIGPLVVLFGLKDNTKLTRIHAAQALTIQIVSYIIAMVIGFIPYVRYFSFVFTVLFFALQIAGAIKAYHEEDFNIPLISDWARNIFKKQIEEDETK